MIDMFPFPRTTGRSTEEKVADILSYLIQFKEMLEFALANISVENLSPELVNKLNELGADIDKSNGDREDEVAQITKNAITISDVCNSETFKLAVRGELLKGIIFNVNFDTGQLEYSVLYEEVI